MDAVVDSNFFMRGRADLDFESLFTTPSVVEELESRGAKNSFEVRSVEIREPSAESVDRVSDESERINSPTSETDEALVALAIDLDAVVVTDDLALQNLASRLDVSFESYMGERIEEERTWVLKCDNCGKEVSGSICKFCGSDDVTRKPD